MSEHVRGAASGKPIPEFTDSQLRRYWVKVALPNRRGCMVWSAGTTNGYGRFCAAGRMYYAHRISYTMANGPIADGMVLDHLCRNRSCVAAEHLEVVTPSENLRRGEGVTAANALKTHCPQGHEYSQGNTTTCSRGKRRCLSCGREQARSYRANQKRNKESTG